jgi:hypothetical protein
MAVGWLAGCTAGASGAALELAPGEAGAGAGTDAVPGETRCGRLGAALRVGSRGPRALAVRPAGRAGSSTAVPARAEPWSTFVERGAGGAEPGRTAVALRGPGRSAVALRAAGRSGALEARCDGATMGAEGSGVEATGGAVMVAVDEGAPSVTSPWSATTFSGRGVVDRAATVARPVCGSFPEATTFEGATASTVRAAAVLAVPATGVGADPALGAGPAALAGAAPRGFDPGREP